MFQYPRADRVGLKVHLEDGRSLLRLEFQYPRADRVGLKDLQLCTEKAILDGFSILVRIVWG